MSNFRSLTLALVLSFPAFAAAEDRRSDTSQVVIMTINTLFMWDGVEPEEGNVDIPWKGSPVEAEEHMEEIATVIIQSDPDIINLVEIENEAALIRLNELFLAGRGYRPYFVQGMDSATGQDLGVLTRIDPVDEELQRDDGQGSSGEILKGVSKNYFATFEINGHNIALVGLHFLARPNDPDRLHQRQAQADLIGDRAEQLASEGFLPVVLGDFNDYDGDVLDHISSQPITNVLSRVKRMQSGNFDDDLVNVAQFVPLANRYTAFWDKDEDSHVDHPGELTSIDHILISPQLVPFVESVQIPHDLDPLEVADHYPIVLTLQFETPGDTPSPSTGGRPRISRLLPNPSGNENETEEVTLINLGDAAVDMTGYVLRDLSETTWTLDAVGTLDAGASIVVHRNGQEMAMTNTGDTIDLVDPEGNVVHSVTYPQIAEGEEVLPEN